MGNHTAPLSETTEPEVPEDSTPTDPIITPDTPPTEVIPTDPTPTPESEPEPEVDEEPEPEPEPEIDPEPPVEPPTEESPVEPIPEPPVEEQPNTEGDLPVESLPVGSVAERAVTAASKIEDPEVRALLQKALADQRIFSKDWDVRYRLEISHTIREMNRWIRTNIPSSASFKTFMEGINSYLLMVETQGIPSMWSAESASATLDEIQARKAAMAIERAIQNVDFDENDPEEIDDEFYKEVKLKLFSSLYRYAQDVREGKIK